MAERTAHTSRYSIAALITESRMPPKRGQCRARDPVRYDPPGAAGEVPELGDARTARRSAIPKNTRRILDPVW